MCGRFSLYDIPEFFREYQINIPEEVAPRANIAPTQTILGIVREQDYEVRRFRWGLIPFWSDTVSTGMINARAETVDRKPTFRQSFRERRCLIPADGFYEWKREGKRKQPYRITIRERKVFSFAGLWESWTSPEGDRIDSCCIITTEPNETVRPVHNRMPVVLPKAVESLWLDVSGDHQKLKEVLQPYPSEEMVIYPVSDRINSPAHDHPDLMEPLRE